MSEVLGHGRIIVEVDEDVRRDLARVEQEFERTMRKLEREQAALSVDDKKFKSQLKEAEARAEKWEKAKYEATLAADTKGMEKADRFLKQARDRIDELTDAQDANHRKLLNNLDAQAKARRKYDQAQEDGERKRAKARVKAETAAASEIDAAYLENWKREKKRIADLETAHERAYREDVNRARSLADAIDKAQGDAFKEEQRRQAALRKEFEKTINRHDALVKASQQRDGQDPVVELELRNVSRELSQLYARLRQFEMDPIQIRVEIDDENLLRERIRAAQTFEQAWDDALKENVRRNKAAAAQYDKDWATAHKEEEGRIKDYNRSWELAHREQERRRIDDITANARLGDSLASLNQQYMKAIQNERKLRLTKTPFRQEKRQELELGIAAATAKVAIIAAQIKALGGLEPEIHIRTEDSMIGRTENRVRKLLDSMRGIGSVAVRVGPFTASMAGLAKSLVVLGPLIVGLVGSLSSLVGILGTGLVGAAITAGGALTGMGIGFTGIFMAVRPVVKEMKNAMSASEALAKVQREHGKGSDEAAKKMKIFNNVMKNQSDSAKENFMAAGEMNRAWRKATEPSRAKAFDVMGRGLKYASDNMGWFSKRTNEASTALGDGLIKWMDRLDSKAGRGVLDGLFNSFNKSLPHVMAGLGNLASYLGKVFGVGAKEGTRLSGVFEAWTDRLNKGFKPEGIKRLVQHARDLGNFLKAAGGAMKTFFGAGADEGSNMLKDMTRGLNDWSKRMRENDTLQKFFKDARENTQALFSAMAPVAVQFVSWSAALMPVVTAILKIVAGFFKAGAAILRFIEHLGTMVGMSSALSTLGATMGIIWGIGKVAAFGAAIGRVIGLLKSLVATAALVKGATMAAFAAGRVGMATGLAGGIAGAAGGAKNYVQAAKAAKAAQVANLALTGATVATGAASTKTGAKVAQAAGKMTLMRAAMAGGAAGATTLNPLLIAGGVAAAAAGFGIYKLTQDTHAWSDAVKSASKNYKDFKTGLDNAPKLAFGAAGARSNEIGAEAQVAAAQKEVNRLVKAGKRGTDEYRDAVHGLRQAQLMEYDAQQQRIAGMKAMRRNNDATFKDALANRDKLAAGAESLRSEDTAGYNIGETFDRIAKGAKDAGIPVNEFMHDYQKMAEFDPMLAAAIDNNGTLANQLNDAADAATKTAAAEAAVNRAAGQTLLNTANIKRAWKELPPIANSAAKSFARINKEVGYNQGKKITTTIATKFENPEKAAAVGKQAASALKRGASGSLVMKIVADSRSAEQAMSRLNATNIPLKRMKIIESGGDAAIRMVQRIIGRKLTPKEMKIISKGGPAALAWASNVKRAQNNIPDANPFIKLIGGSEALTTIGAVASRLGSLAGTVARTFIDIITRKKGGGDFSGGIHGAAMPFAAGGRTDDKLVKDAYAQASKQTPTPNKGGKYAKPTLLVGEERRDEFVIATNPAYRTQNKGYLRAAASALGMTLSEEDDGVKPKVTRATSDIIAAAGGVAKAAKNKKKAKKKKKGKNGDKPAATKPAKPLYVPNDYDAGKLPLEKAQKNATDATNAFKSRRSKIQTLEERERRQRKDLKGKSSVKPKDKDGNVKKGDAGKSPKERQYDLIHDTAREIEKAKKGNQKARIPLDKLSFEDLKADMKKDNDRLARTKKFNRKIKDYETIINTQGALMSKASTQYTTYGDSLKGVPGGDFKKNWDDARKIREDTLTLLRDLYKAAKVVAPDGTTWDAELGNLEADVDDQLTTSQLTEALQGPERTEIALEEFLRSKGRDVELLGLENKLAEASYATPTVEDNPATPENERIKSLEDDILAAENIKKFYEGLLADPTFTSGMPTNVQTELYGAIKDARDAEKALRDESSGTTESGQPALDPAAVRDTARYEAMRTYGSNAAALSTVAPGAAASPGYTPMTPGTLKDPVTASTGYEDAAATATRASGTTGYDAAPTEAPKATVPITPTRRAQLRPEMMDDPARDPRDPRMGGLKGRLDPRAERGRKMDGRKTPNIHLPNSAAKAIGGAAAAGMSGVAGTPTTKNVNTTINNSFPTPPPEPHAWSQGVIFEMAGLI